MARWRLGDMHRSKAFSTQRSDEDLHHGGAPTTPRARLANGCGQIPDRGRQRRRPVRRAGVLGEPPESAWDKGSPGDASKARAISRCTEIKGERRQAAGSLRRGAVDTLGSADHRCRARLRPSHPAIGAAMIGWFGMAMLCYVTPKEHLGSAGPRRREGWGDRLPALPPMLLTWRKAIPRRSCGTTCSRRCAEPIFLVGRHQFNLSGDIRHGAKFPRRDAAKGRPQGGASLAPCAG